MLALVPRRPLNSSPRTSKILWSCPNTPTCASRTSMSEVGTEIPKELKGSGSIRPLLKACLLLLRLAGEVFPPQKLPLAHFSSSFITLTDSSTFFQNTRRSGGASADDGYSANNNEEESLWTILVFMVMLGVGGVGNPAIIHFTGLRENSHGNQKAPADGRFPVIQRSLTRSSSGDDRAQVCVDPFNSVLSSWSHCHNLQSRVVGDQITRLSRLGTPRSGAG